MTLVVTPGVIQNIFWIMGNEKDGNCMKEEWNFENWGVKYWSKTKEFLEYVNNQK